MPIPATGWTQGPLEQADAIVVWNGRWTMDDEGTLARWAAMLAAGFVRAEVRRPASSPEDVPTDPTTDSVATSMVALTNPVFVATT